MLWIYIILSPLAYLGAVAPLTQGIFITWWRQFSQQLFTGPILAFFIWLALATLGQFSDSNAFLKANGFVVPGPERPIIGVTEVGTTAHMMRLGISLSLLIGGLMVAKSFGGVAGGAAAAGMSRLQGGAGWIKRKTTGLAKRGAVAAARGTGRVAWKGAKATGRGGLALARTVDYKASKGIASALGREYQSDKGIATRFASAARQNLMTKEGLKNTFNKATGDVFNRNINRQRAAAATNRYHYDKGVRYDWDNEKNDGTLKSKNGVAFGGFKAFMPGSFSENFYKQRSAGTAFTAQEAAQIAQYKKEQEEAVKPYKDKSKEELRSIFGTANHQQRLGISRQLAELGGFAGQGMFDEAKKEFANNPIKMRDFLETTQKKQPELVYDLSGGKGSDDWEALSREVGKKKIKLSDLNLATTDDKSDDDLRKLGRLMDLWRDAVGEEGFNKQLATFEETGDPKTVQKMHKSYNLQSDDKATEINRKLAEMRIEGKPPEEILAEEAKLNNDLMRLRTNTLTLDPNGDLVKAFSDKLGRFDEAMATRFMSRASTTQLANINANANPLKEPITAQAVERAMANGMNYQKLLTLYKSSKNPDLVNFAAKALAKYNHPDSEKIIYNITNDVDFDVNASKQNKVIEDLMRENITQVRAKHRNPNDLTGFINAFRTTTKASDYNESKGKLKANSALKKQFEDYLKSL
jgi:hypothetical protein